MNISGGTNINSSSLVFNDFYYNRNPQYFVNRKTDNDSFELSNKKEEEKTPNYKKIALGLTAAAATIAASLFVYKRINPKFYFENIQKVKLEQNLQFSEFTSREEAVKFAKEKLQIKEIDENVPLDALNDVIKSIIDISNKNKGEFFNTNRIAMIKNGKDTTIAQVYSQPADKTFGRLEISENFYDMDFLDKAIRKDLYDKNGNRKFTRKYYGFQNTNTNAINIANKEFKALIDKFYNTPNDMTKKEKQNLYFSMCKFWEQHAMSEINPMILLRRINDKYPGILSKECINLEEIAKKTKEEQQQYLKKLLKNTLIYTEIKVKTIEESIYHEFGHLQDFMQHQNILKDPFLYNARYLTRGEYDNPSEEFKKYRERLKKLGQEDKLKKPEFLTNQEEQSVAQEVSLYATTSVGEFIAETYSQLIKGNKLSDRIMALYKKYNGPMLNN